MKWEQAYIYVGSLKILYVHLNKAKWILLQTQMICFAYNNVNKINFWVFYTLPQKDEFIVIGDVFWALSAFNISTYKAQFQSWFIQSKDSI